MSDPHPNTRRKKISNWKGQKTRKEGEILFFRETPFRTQNTKNRKKSNMVLVPSTNYRGTTSSLVGIHMFSYRYTVIGKSCSVSRQDLS